MRFMVLPYLFLANICFAQSDFIRGYVVHLSGDTSHGYLQKDINDKLTNGVMFRIDQNNEPGLMSVNEISAFAFDDGNIYKAISYYDGSGIQKKEFGKYLLEGKYNLYSLSHNETYSFYVKTSTDSGYYLFDDVMGIAGKIETWGNFRNLLTYFIQGCQKLRSSTYVAFNEKSILEFFRELSSCSGDVPVVVHYKKAKGRIAGVIYAGGLPGADHSQLSFQGQMRFYSPDFSKKASLVIGVSYAEVINYEFSNVLNTKGKYEVKILSVPFFFQYNFTTSRFQPLAYLGFSIANKRQNNPESFDPHGFQKSNGLALLGGIGFEYNPFDHFLIKADWRHELVRQNPSIGIGYRF